MYRLKSATLKYLPTHGDGKRDYRYTIREEYCGYVDPRWVVRYCGDWIGQYPTVNSASQAAQEHKDHA